MFFEGIVEQDDIEYGYVRVRIFGKHNRDKNILPTKDLPKAKIVYSGESNIDEISYYRTICNGTWTVCGFLDNDQQHPIVLGSIVKTVDALPNFNNGFTDENSEHPDSEHLNESTIPRLARNEKITDTIQQDKIDDTEAGQPSNNFAPVYPKNRVLQTKKHVIEIDDTDGHERINIYHKSGAFIEFNPDGSIVEKSKGDKFLSVADDLNIIVHGNINIETNIANVTASEANIEATTVNIKGDVIVEGDIEASGTITGITGIMAGDILNPLSLANIMATNEITAKVNPAVAPAIKLSTHTHLAGGITDSLFGSCSGESDKPLG